MNSADGVLLQASLELAVPLRIRELQAAGGPSREEWERVRGSVDDLIAHGDELLYRSRKAGETAARFVRVVDAVAVLSFAPLGIRAFGCHFRAYPGWRWKGRTEMSLALDIVLDEPAWPELAAQPERVVHVTAPLGITCLDGGMASGKPSVALRVDLPDGRAVIAETSLALLVTATRALVARYGDPTQGA